MEEVSTEDAKILFKDLCAKYPYGVRGQVYLKVPRVIDWHLVDEEIVVEVKLLGIQGESLIVTAVDENGDIVDELDNNRILVEECYEITCFNFKPYLRSMDDMTKEEEEEFSNMGIVGYQNYDWLNAHHFDYPNLIKHGLAIDCTNLNIYKYGRMEGYCRL